MIKFAAPILLCTFICAVVATYASPLQPPIVQTKYGAVSGFVKTLDEGQQVHIYEGIRYGKPPIGDLRFRKPEPAEKWTGVYNASGYRTACLQPNELVPDNNVPETDKRSEDCLFLSIYRPSSTSLKPRPVMMWIHGGGFETGSIFSIAYDASYIVSYGDVIVVTIQYRLGPFGFLHASDDDDAQNNEDAPGNAGLHDQILALKWIRDNIAQFGGDANQVTIFGESAGGMSVGALVLSPLTNGLFRRAIMQSGAPNSYLGSESKQESKRKLAALTKTVGCDKQTTAKDIVECLRALPAQKIEDAVAHARANGETFEPIYGDELLPTKPAEALKSGKFNRNLDFMFGTVSEEGALFVESLFPDFMDPDIPRENVTLTVQQARVIIAMMFDIFKEPYGAEVAEFYTRNLAETDKDAIRQAIGYTFGDFHITCPTVLFGDQYARLTPANRVFAYRVVQPPSLPVFLKCHGWMGVCHGDDVLLLFGFPIRLRGIVYTENDYKLSVDMIHAWTRFARTGEPLSPMPNGAQWTPAIDTKDGGAKSTVAYMSLTASKYEMVRDYYAKTCYEFWKPKIL